MIRTLNANIAVEKQLRIHHILQVTGQTHIVHTGNSFRICSTDLVESAVNKLISTGEDVTGK